MNDRVPYMEPIAQANSGKRMDEILRLFRKRLFYETMRAKQNAVD